MEKAPLISFITAMFTILNPIGSIAIFAGMVSDYPAADRRKVAVKCAIAVAVILVVTVWAGEYLLDLFGVEVPGLQAAGGLIIALIALSMLHSRQSAIHDTAHNEEAPAPDQDIAVVPLALSMIAGPGAMVTVIVNTHTHPGVAANLVMSVVCVVLAAAMGVGFLGAEPITRLLGDKGLDVVTKLMGLILFAIAAGMFATGAKGLLPGLSG